MIPAVDREPMPMYANGQDWLSSWWPPDDKPIGIPHGATGICVTAADELVLVSEDGTGWGLPGGRPEAGEDDEATLRREVWEESCAVVVTARLLGYGRGECVRGRQLGEVLVRSFWRAEVELKPWRPRFEIAHRKIVPISTAIRALAERTETETRMSLRALHEAGIAVGGATGDAPPTVHGL